MNPSITLTMSDGVRIVVPDSLNLMTTYVLLEQEDWFESEIKFLRKLLKPGYKVIDIGANYGVYTLSMAKTIGETGSLWAFEPASSTMKLLLEGISNNGFKHVVSDQSALSSICGEAKLSININSEMNSLTSGNLNDAYETVPLVTLNTCMKRYNWNNIDFIKIDAEGEESNILKGGGRFFSENSPLVQYEIKAGASIHIELVNQFKELGYDSYRLVPGMDILIPFDENAPIDPYLLNLFCCKKDRAKQLHIQGNLLDADDLTSSSVVGKFKSRFHRMLQRKTYCWQNTIVKLPYGILLAQLWSTQGGANNSKQVEKSLSLYETSLDITLPLKERFVALLDSFSILNKLCKHQPTGMRLSSLARVAQDYGAREVAVHSLHMLENIIVSQNGMDLGEPFLAPSRYFESVSPEDVIGNWVQTAILETSERLGSFSGFFSGKASLPQLIKIRDLKFGSPEMKRRLDLLQRRYQLSFES